MKKNTQKRKNKIAKLSPSLPPDQTERKARQKNEKKMDKKSAPIIEKKETAVNKIGVPLKKPK